MAAFATALQNISSDLITIEKQAPAGLNVLIYLYYSKLQTFLYFFYRTTMIVKRKNVFTFYTFTAPSELVPDIFRVGWGQKSISSVHFADNH